MTQTLTLDGARFSGIDGEGVDWRLKPNIDGWWGSPSAEQDATRRPGQHGSWLGDTTLEPRVIAPSWLLSAPSHTAAVAAVERLKVAASLTDVVVRVETPAGAKWCRARRDRDLLVTWHSDRQATISLQLMAADPRVFGDERTYYLQSGGSGRGVFEYDVVYPVTYGNPDPGQTSAVLTNAGNAEAYPIVTVEGDFPTGFRLIGGDQALVFHDQVWSGTPVIVDFAARTVTQSGALRTVALSRREWWTVPAQGDAAIALMPGSSGNGFARVTISDTYL